jgi:hypothetical protein
MGKRITTNSGLTIGLDLGDRFTEGRVLDGSGEVVEAFRVRTTEAALSARLATFPPSRAVLEVGTHSPWVSRAVTRLGYEAIVASHGSACSWPGPVWRPTTAWYRLGFPLQLPWWTRRPGPGG